MALITGTETITVEIFNQGVKDPLGGTGKGTLEEKITISKCIVIEDSEPISDGFRGIYTLQLYVPASFQRELLRPGKYLEYEVRGKKYVQAEGPLDRLAPQGFKLLKYKYGVKLQLKQAGLR